MFCLMCLWRKDWPDIGSKSILSVIFLYIDLNPLFIYFCTFFNQYNVDVEMDKPLDMTGWS